MRVCQSLEGRHIKGSAVGGKKLEEKNDKKLQDTLSFSVTPESSTR
jgi:hypothetical protein